MTSDPDADPAFSRREFLRTASLGGLAVAASSRSLLGQATAGPAGGIALRDAPTLVRLGDGRTASGGDIVVEREWTGDRCSCRLVNRSRQSHVIREVVLFAAPHRLGSDTPLYGESFQMLSQTYGTLRRPVKLGYDEEKHYRFPTHEGAVTVRSLAMFSPTNAPRQLLAFSSCRRFGGEIRIWPDRLEVVMDAEDRPLAAGASWELEEFVHFSGEDREALLDQLATAIARYHPRLAFPKIPTGWCSWYYYGKRLTEADIRQNLDAISRDGSKLEYIQIDDGYQPAHGDWLEPNPKFFPSGIKALCREIRDRGFQPAIWVAPFIASPKSQLLRDHPDWFVQGTDGSPLSAEQVTFRGWNDAPWYMLDATQPAVQAHLEKVFAVMREEWGCTYFKLDANFWGSVHGSRYADRNATRIENYRRGMAAVRRGAGEGSFLLGCNAPMWASLGAVHGMRVTGDIKRAWDRFSRCARENFHRNWQHGRLWINDPDCLVASPLTRGGAAPVSADELGFHAAAIVASGGMMLNGDNYAGLTDAQKAVVARAVPPTGVAARFATEDFLEGIAELSGGRRLVFVFNWADTPRSHQVAFGRHHQWSDFWTGAGLGAGKDYTLPTLPPHSARVIVATPA